MGKVSGSLRQRVLDWLADNVPESRIKHILGVEEMAIALAQLHQENVEKAAQAGLMHDLAKYFKPRRLLEMAKSEGLSLDPVDEINPHLLHADISAIVAREEFGITDPDILEAIANHTLGKPGMSALSCIVFVADSLELGRGDTPELEQLRQVSREDLGQAVWMTCDYSFRYLLETRRLIHPRTVLTRNWFLHQSTRSTLSKTDFIPPSSLSA
ncbi:bis(5'-nucleosyl)-tetraphosphatase (symmetrical) YqeK [Oscillatoria sp. FACHB-1407]|uniref:bis(5'-nucleosyl)-tetraphosphatase (symmetrical) YqeK n=1 Tax=Oscillatoria sp. FACHB-1407 TaxID=2692847 RepID=UPI001683ED0A|nr:bis(5'-nucleosyl)-tetraphosphatase (symmetrical) YqeK [Oscillatoria sp. FACHB-1407]MBD2462886.1 bis(5'-nucleosyl)-tetraphosphatase (symmetrical) YqeK [Oscillatoria sp. FACHB-1407]